MEKEKSKPKKVLAVIGNVIVWLFVVFAAVVTIFTFAAQSSADGVPAIGGKAILTVQTDSMAPTFEKGDVIIGQKLMPDDAKALQVDDIITFDAGDLDGDGVRDLNSHRIIQVNKEDGSGFVSYITQGDNVQFADQNSVDSTDVICKYTGTRIKGLGKVLGFLQTPNGFLIAVVIPMILFFILELIQFIRKYLEIRGSKKITPDDEERIRRQAIEEFMRMQEAEKAAAAANKDDPDGDSADENL